MHTHVREHTHTHILIRTLYTHIPSLSFFFSHSPIHFLPMNHNNGYSRFGRNSSMRKRLARASERTNKRTNDAIKWYQTDNINLANSFAFLTTGDCSWSENILFFFLKLLECCFSTIVLWAAECGDGGGVAARLSRFSFLLGTFTEPARVSINAR